VRSIQRLMIPMLLSLAVTGAAAGADQVHTQRQDLVGAWRLVRIEVTGTMGASVDPFYGVGSEGVMIYDASGWFSVQIMGSNRPAVEVPIQRPGQADDAQRDRQAAALNTYYAYYGTWTFDPATSTVTHHAKGALYPSEHDAIYAQHVEVTGAQMIFSRTQNVDGKPSTQRKVWIRASSP
jgi:Lipocalin-like domain